MIDRRHTEILNSINSTLRSINLSTSTSAFDTNPLTRYDI